MTQARSLPQLIRLKPTSDELACMHEAGHAFAATVVGFPPAEIELYAGSPASGRTNIPGISSAPDEARRCVAVAGFALEAKLFRDGRLLGSDGNPMDPANQQHLFEFINQSIGRNAFDDKVRFFGEDREQANQTWPKADDEMFRNVGLGMGHIFVMPRVNVMPLIEALATALLNSGRLGGAEISVIARLHGLNPR